MLPSRNKSFYTCLINWYHELGETDLTIYPSLKMMEKHVKCYDACSIVKVTLKPNGTYTAEKVKDGTDPHS